MFQLALLAIELQEDFYLVEQQFIISNRFGNVVVGTNIKPLTGKFV